MSNLADMIWVEWHKVIRSRILLGTALGSLFIPVGIALLIFVSRSPQLSQNLGIGAAKSSLSAYATTDWPAYLGILAQVVAGGGFLLFILIVSWVFGREFVDGTLKDMLAVPIQRSSILVAKFIVIGVWSAALALAIVVVGLVMGAVVGLPGGSFSVIVQGSLLVMITTCLVVAAIIPFAFFASAGRGYLLPIGAGVLVLMITNLVAIAGLGGYFPWSVPGLYAQAKFALAPISYWIVFLTSLAGLAATYLWWKLADQSR